MSSGSEPSRGHRRNVTEQLGNEQADIGNECDEQQSDDHAQIERQRRLDDLFHGALGHGRTDEQNCTYRRGQQTDAAVEHHHDTELDGIEADTRGDGQQNGSGDQDDGRHIHDAAQNQQDQVEQQRDEDGIAGQVGNGIGSQIRHMQGGQAVAEGVGAGNKDEHDGQGVDTLAQFAPNALPVQTFVHKDRHDQGVDNGDSCRLGGGKDTAHDAEHHDDDGRQSPDRNTELFEEDLQAEFVAFGVVAAHRNDVGTDHQAQSQNRAGHITGQEQAAHADATSGGCVDDHVVAGGHQQAFAGGSNGNSGGEVGVIALIHHHGDHDGTDGRGIRRSGAGDAAEEVGSHDVDHSHAAAHPAYAGVCQCDKLFTNAAGPHEHPHGDEERHGHQTERRNTFDHLLAQGVEAEALNAQAENGGQRYRIGNGEAQEDHHKKAAEQHDDGKSLNIHIMPRPPLQRWT